MVVAAGPQAAFTVAPLTRHADGGVELASDEARGGRGGDPSLPWGRRLVRHHRLVHALAALAAEAGQLDAAGWRRPLKGTTAPQMLLPASFFWPKFKFKYHHKAFRADDSPFYGDCDNYPISSRKGAQPTAH